MTPEATTLPRPRFFWPGLLVALPLLVLAGLAAAGLRSRWKSRLVEAQEEGQRTVDRMSRDVEQALREVAAGAHPVRLYDDPPQPPAEVSPAWKEAVTSGSLTDFLNLRDAPDPAWTEAGLPVAALAAWEVFSHDPTRENASALVETVIVRHPSAVSSVILTQATALAKSKNLISPELETSPARWSASQAERTILTRHQEGSTGLRPVSITKTEGPTKKWMVDQGHLWFLQSEAGNTFLAAASPALGQTMSQTAESGIPDWMGVSLWLGGERIFWNQGSMEKETHGPEPRAPDALLAEREGRIRVRAELTDADKLYAPLRTEIVWASGVIGAATVAAGGGLWLSRRALRREERLHALKSQFVASVSHELRAPIGSVRLMAEALASGTVKGEAAESFYRLLSQEGVRLSALIENVLDFASMESGRKAYQFSETDIPSLLRDTIALLEPRAAPRGITLQLNSDPLPQVPEVDALAVQQAVMNLLDNALKFSPPSGIITVTLANNPPRGWTLSIADEGPGIPPAEHARIFERFHRLGNELRRETPGTGIGLSLVQHIAEGHGGKVTVACREPAGSTFTLHFPWIRNA